MKNHDIFILFFRFFWAIKWNDCGSGYSAVPHVCGSCGWTLPISAPLHYHHHCLSLPIIIIITTTTMAQPRSAAGISPGSPTLSATSSTTSTVHTVIDTQPNPKSLINLGKQLKYLSIGLILTSYFQVYSHLRDALSVGLTTFSARLALLSVGLLGGTIVIFTYVILLPARGHSVNYVDWKNDKHLAGAIPALTACIIFGWIALLLTLSPVGAPAPPAASIKQRLAQAAAYTGLSGLQAKVNAIPTSYFPNTAAKGVGMNWDKISSVLSLGSVNTATGDRLKEYFTQLSERAEQWGARNIMTIGWTGALLGSVGTYLMVFGAVGLTGFVAPDNRKDKAKTF